MPRQSRFRCHNYTIYSNKKKIFSKGVDVKDEIDAEQQYYSFAVYQT